MALRAQRKRQGGSSRGGGRPSVVTSTPGQGATFTQPGKRPGFAAPQATGPTPQAPSASYIRRPAPAPTVPTPGPSSTALRTNAASNIGIARGQNRDAIFRAVMQLGDPTEIAKYQANPEFAGYQFAQDPNSVFASLARQETKGLQDIDTNSNVGNTFFSGMRLRDRQELSDETGRQRLAGSTSFLDDLKNYAASLGLSESQYRQSLSDADQMDIDAALAQDRVNRDNIGSEPVPTPSAPAGPPPVVPGLTPSQVQQTLASLSNPNFGKDAEWNIPAFRTEQGKDSHGNPGVWHIYPDGHRVFVRRR